MTIKTGLSLLLSVFVIAACQQNTQQADDDSGNGATEKSAGTGVNAVEVPATSSDGDVRGMSYQAQIDAAKVDFARRFDKSEDQFEVWEAVGVDWASGALGCPMKGMNYTQSLVPGFLIVIRVGENEHHYHAKKGGEPFFCSTDRVEKPASTMRNAIM